MPRELEQNLIGTIYYMPALAGTYIENLCKHASYTYTHTVLQEEILITEQWVLPMVNTQMKVGPCTWAVFNL